ncbi:hypothetical protein ACWFNE_09325 [Cellulomonas sp. NPDC055163]
MRLPDDDEIYDVDQTYLGPPGRYIGRFRYRAILIGPVVFLVGLVAVNQSGVGYSLLSIGLLAIGTGWLTGWIVDHTSQERPVGVLIQTMAHELTARRALTKGSRSRPTRAFQARTTEICAVHELPSGRRRWRSYANRAASEGS